VAKAAEVRLAVLHLAAQAPRAPIGSCLSMVDVVTALFYQYLNLDWDTPGQPNRDRVVLSKAQALLTMQPILAELGALPEEAYDTLALDNCRAPGIPNLGVGPGLDAAPHLPGLGLGIAAGHALAGQMAGAAWRTYCLMGDGECVDGAVWEAAHFAANYRLGNLVAIVDRNGMTADGPTIHRLDPEPLAGKWMTAGWDVIEIDGHRMDHIVWALEDLPAPTEPKPVVILARTASGAGVEQMRDNATWHSGVVTADLVRAARADLESFAQRQLAEIR